LTRQCYEGISGIILVFDVTNKSSFDNLSKYWLPKIIENSDTNIELALVGNKTDLINDRQVSSEQAEELLKTSPWFQK
jgi:GTPase SAR1 family protein